jgi:hypothetical protein
MSDSYTEIKYTAPPQSRNEAILAATVDGTEYTDPPQSRVEDLLVQVKEKIEQGGGGGTSDYTDLANKPQINGTTLTGDKSSADLGLLPASTRYGASISANKYIEFGTGKKLIDTSLKDQNGNAMTTITSDQPVIDIGCDSSGLLVTYPSARASVSLGAAMSGKVDKVQGKGLSTNDFTNAYKNGLTVMMANPLNHNAIFRGEDHTNKYTVEEWYDMVHSGNFDDLYLGDYRTVTITTDIMTKFTGETFESGVDYYEMGGGVDVTARTWTLTEDATPQSGKIYATKTAKTENVTIMFAGFDYYYNMGDTALTTHHAILIPKGAGFATTAKMNPTNTSAGGYYGSDMHQITLPCYAKSLKTALGNHLLSHKTWLTTTVNTTTPSMAGTGMTGAASASAWETTELQLMNEVQLYGSMVWSSSAYDVGVDNEKLPIFNFINPVHFGRNTFWLRSVVSSTGFTVCSGYGGADYGGASYALSMRPIIVFG